VPFFGLELRFTQKFELLMEMAFEQWSHAGHLLTEVSAELNAFREGKPEEITVERLEALRRNLAEAKWLMAGVAKAFWEHYKSGQPATTVEKLDPAREREWWKKHRRPYKQEVERLLEERGEDFEPSEEFNEVEEVFQRSGGVFSDYGVEDPLEEQDEDAEHSEPFNEIITGLRQSLEGFEERMERSRAKYNAEVAAQVEQYLEAREKGGERDEYLDKFVETLQHLASRLPPDESGDAEADREEPSTDNVPLSQT